MISIGVRHDLKELEKFLTKIEKKQMPFATAQSLNNTKKRIQGFLMTRMVRILDRPTPFTMNSFDDAKGNWATKKRPVAWIKFKRIQGEYLYPLIHGGTETDLHIVPTKAARKNKYGNLPRTSTATMKKDKGKFFYGKPKGGGQEGWYQRYPSNKSRKSKGGAQQIRLAAFYTRSRNYKRIFPFYTIVRTRFNPLWPKEFDRSFARAMLTAK